MTELGVKGTLCGIGGSMGLEVLDCAEKQASKGLRGAAESQASLHVSVNPRTREGQPLLYSQTPARGTRKAP